MTALQSGTTKISTFFVSMTMDTTAIELGKGSQLI